MAKKVLILSGGGGKGSFQAGVIEQLHKTGWRPDVVAGISVGALNGAVVATGRAMRLTGLWRNIKPSMVLQRRGALSSGWRYALHKAGLKNPTLGYYDNSPLRETLKANISSQFSTDFYCGTVDIETGAYRSHWATRGMSSWNHIDPILASTAIPVVFDPVVLGGINRFAHQSLHVDGGVKHMSAIGSVLKRYSDIEEVVIITCSPYKKDWTTTRPARDMVDIAKNAIGYVLEEIFEKDIREFERINHIVRQLNGVGVLNRNGNRYSVYPARLFQPSESLGDSLNFTSEQARKNIEIGLHAEAIEL